MTTEKWESIKYFEKYEISNLGNVRSWVNNASKLTKVPKILKPSVGKNGYLFVTLYPNSKYRPKRISIHRLVALHFITNPNNYDIVNHIDENKSNNIVTNLEWCTSKYNLEYSSIHARGIKTKNLNKTSNSEKPVSGFKNGILIFSFKSIAEAARETKCSRWGIRRCLLKQIEQTKDIKWQYTI